MQRKDYPSVTQILSPWQDFSHVPEEKLAAAADRGSRVHELSMAYARRVFIFPSAEVKPYVDSFRGWFDEYVEEVIATEARIFNDVYRFSGQVDLIAVLKGERSPAVIDYKTPVTESKLWRLQCAGYLKLAEHYNAIRTMALMLSPEGKPARAIPYTETAADTAVFLQMVGVWHYLRRT